MLNSRDTNRFQMLLAVLSYMNLHNAVWSSIPIIGVFKAELDGLTQGVKDKLKLAGIDTSGMTISKNSLKEQIAQKAAVLSGALASYCAVNGKDDLLSNGYLTQSQVQSLRDVNLPEVISNFIALLSTEVASMVDYGVTQAQVDDLARSVDDFRELIGLPRLKRSEANIAKQEATSIIDQGTDLLNDKMDKMMLQFKQSNLTFYDGYQSARMIVN
jgi:hypothetical protein